MVPDTGQVSKALVACCNPISVYSLETAKPEGSECRPAALPLMTDASKKYSTVAIRIMMEEF